MCLHVLLTCSSSTDFAVAVVWCLLRTFRVLLLAQSNHCRLRSVWDRSGGQHACSVKHSMTARRGDNSSAADEVSDTPAVHAQTALIVYDEIHYLRDVERGVVSEETTVP